jgi:hypothetical protein
MLADKARLFAMTVHCVIPCVTDCLEWGSSHTARSALTLNREGWQWRGLEFL